MRGAINLAGHKLVGAFKPLTHRTYPTRIRRKDRAVSAEYRQLWRIVDGAVRDALASHPEYLTDHGKRNAREAIIKRVTGSLYGYATQVARGRSASLTSDVAAEGVRGAVRTPGLMALLTSKARLWWRNFSSPRNSIGSAT